MMQRDDDAVRLSAREDALARLAARPGLRSQMTPEQIRAVEDFDGVVLLGSSDPSF